MKKAPPNSGSEELLNQVSVNAGLSVPENSHVKSSSLHHQLMVNHAGDALRFASG
jgi:hypothetical protein